MVEEHLSAQLSDELGTDVIAVQPGEDVEVDARFESVMEGVLASGTVESLARGACVRCLEPVSQPVLAHFQELFAYADRAAHHHEVGDDDEDRHRLEGDLLDLEPILRDAVVLQLPFQPVCRPDCPGLCSECGQPLADDPDHAHENIDPRWASLQTFTVGSADVGQDEMTEERRN